MSRVVQADSTQEPTANTSSLNSALTSQPLTDSGNGERFVKLHGPNVRCCPEYKAWFVWDGKRWKRDRQGMVHRMAKKTARSLYLAALSIEGNDEESRKR